MTPKKKARREPQPYDVRKNATRPMGQQRNKDGKLITVGMMKNAYNRLQDGTDDGAGDAFHKIYIHHFRQKSLIVENRFLCGNFD